MKVIQKKSSVWEKEWKWKKNISKRTETEKDILLMYKTILQITKLFFFSVQKQFWQFPVRQHYINSFYHSKGKWQSYYNTQKRWYLARTISSLSVKERNILEVLLVRGKQSNLKLHWKTNFCAELFPLSH